MYRLAYLFLVLCLSLAFTVPSHAQPIIDPVKVPSIVVRASIPHAYPADPPSDIPWSASYRDLNDVVTAFNNARGRENALLNIFIKPMTAPSAATWAAWSDGEKALWLVNDERVARGLAPLQGLENNVNDVAQAYAEWLLANNKFAHDADGRTPVARMNTKAAIAACHDVLGIYENLYFQGTTSADGIPLVIEQAVYMWIYSDAAYGWGHRHAALWTPYTENSGAADREGFVGVGHARGSYVSPFDGKTYPYTDMIVMNFFDPCATWVTTTPEPLPPPPDPTPVATPKPPPLTHAVSGKAAAPTWETVVSQPFERTTWPSVWHVADTNGATGGDFKWIAADCNVFAGEFSGMAVGGGVNGMELGCSDNYPNNARSWLTFGPFSLQDAIGAVVEAKVWVYTEPYNDELCIAASTDAKQYDGVCVSGSSGGWVEEQLDLGDVYRVGNLLGRSNLYVGFAFITNDSVTRPNGGAYVDNILLRKQVKEPGDALYGVEISSEDGHTTFTDQAGNFNLAGLTPGKHTLTPSRPGYEFHPSSFEVDLTPGNQAGVTFIGVPRVVFSMRSYTVHLPLICPD
jgi:hypothetical protein